jgi:hypothetical protein
MGVKLVASSGGSVELVPTNTASDFTVTVPAATGTMLTTASTAVVTQAMLSTNVAGNGPAFSAYINSTQAFTAGVWTKVQLNAEEWDTNSNFDSTTNYRFTPTVAGYYQINCEAASISSTYSNANQVGIYKNGTQYKTAYLSTYGAPTLATMVYLNGSTDYVELYANLGTSQNLIASSATTFMSGFLARAA